MDHSVVFARHFAQLVWLTLHEPGNTDEQKAALRALVAASKESAVSLVLRGKALDANDASVSSTLTGVTDFVAQMMSHGLAMITADANASASDLLAVVRLLTETAAEGDGGVAIEARRVALGVATVRFASLPRDSQHRSSLPDMEFGDVFDDPLAEARSRATPRSSPLVPAPTSSGSHATLAGGMFAQFAATRIPTETYEELLRQLDAAIDPGIITYVLDNLVLLTQIAARDGKHAVVGEIMIRITKRWELVDDLEAKRAFLLAMRRLAKHEPLRAVATELSQHPEQLDDYIAVFGRAGDDGTDVLIEQITAAAQQRSRHLFFAALVQLKAGVPALLHLLGDPQWFVARNAAELLGEMQVREAEQPLTDLSLRHEDERVRRAAKGALMRLGTPRSMQAIQEALADNLPQARMEAAAALITRKDGRSASTR